MEVEESIYEGDEAPQTKHPRVYVNQANAQKTQGGESTPSTGSAKNRTNNLKNKYVDRSKRNNPDTPSCMMHGAGYYIKNCKVLLDYISTSRIL